MTTPEVIDLLLDLRTIFEGSKETDIESASEWQDGVNYGLGQAIKVIDHKLSLLIGSGT